MSSMLGAVPEVSTGREQRRAERVRVNHRLAIRLKDTLSGEMTDRPAVFWDLSLLGACVWTRQRLWPGQWIDVMIPTEGAPHESGLPRAIEGRACVKRVRQRPDNTQQVSVSFGPSLAHSLDLATYMAYLLGF